MNSRVKGRSLHATILNPSFPFMIEVQPRHRLVQSTIERRSNPLEAFVASVHVLLQEIDLHDCNAFLVQRREALLDVHQPYLVLMCLLPPSAIGLPTKPARS